MTSRCAVCHTELAPSLRHCPGCGRLLHGAALKTLARQAAEAEDGNDLPTALARWREALALAPAQSRQHAVITATVTDLSKRLSHHPVSKKFTTTTTGVGVAGLLLWKFKFLLVMLLSQAKLLMVGLTEAGTLFSMLLSLGVYWAAWGWRFALGLIVSIYIHEMGHVAALRRYGIRATAPMFIPGLGALVHMKQHPTDARESAYVGLAGPFWGLGAGVVAYVVSIAAGWPSWGAIAKVGGWLTLFNLTPVWQLDGSRAFDALSRTQRWLIVAMLAALWLLTAEGLLALVGLVAAWRAMQPAPARGDRSACMSYLFLLVASTWLTRLPVRVPGES